MHTNISVSWLYPGRDLVIDCLCHDTTQVSPFCSSLRCIAIHNFSTSYKRYEKYALLLILFDSECESVDVVHMWGKLVEVLLQCEEQMVADMSGSVLAL